MKNLKQIKAFILVSELNSFKLAAEKLFISTTAVSKQIQVLESQLDEQLFIRTTRHIKLTEFGKQYYQLCKNIEKNIEELDSFTYSKKIEPQGKLNILIQNSAAKLYVLSHLKTFMDLYPKIELIFEFSERKLDLNKENFDIIISYALSTNTDESLSHKKIMTMKHILCAAPSYIKKYNMPKDSSALIDYKFLMHSLRVPDHFFTLADGKQVLIAKPYIKMNDFEAMIKACCDGLGIILTLDLLVKDRLEKKELVSILPNLNYQNFDLFLYYHSTKYEQSAVRVFCEYFGCES